MTDRRGAEFAMAEVGGAAGGGQQVQLLQAEVADGSEGDVGARRL